MLAREKSGPSGYYLREERGSTLKNNFYLDRTEEEGTGAPWIIKDRYIITYQSGRNYGSFGRYEIAGYKQLQISGANRIFTALSIEERRKRTTTRATVHPYLNSVKQ